MALPQNTLRDVFISYCGSDELIMNRVIDRLTREGLEVWYVPADIRDGDGV